MKNRLIHLKFELKYKSEIIYGNEVGDYDTQFKEIASLIKNIPDLKAIKVISNNDMANGRNKIYGNIIILTIINYRSAN